MGGCGLAERLGSFAALLPQFADRSLRSENSCDSPALPRDHGKAGNKCAKTEGAIANRASLYKAIGRKTSNLKIRRAGLIVGSVIDPALIANPHIRAHALEGQLFRTALAGALRAKRIGSVVFTERDAYPEASARLYKSIGEVQRVIQALQRPVEGPWRAEQKLAAVAAWIALNQRCR
jgi:hypothetical protein